MSSEATQPLVSCIMPTRDRRAFVPRAIATFLRQDYPNAELIVVDDGAEAVEDLIPVDPRLRYLRLDGSRTLGAKRNECVIAARGNLIMHWDDDDWMAPNRIRRQVEALIGQRGEVCGLRRMLFHEPSTGRTWLYEYPSHEHPWLAGGSLLYTREFWRRSPFPDIQVGSDTRFIWDQSLDRAVVLPDLDLYVALIHPGNTSPKNRQGAYWTPWSGELPRLVAEDLGEARPTATPAIYSILMVCHNTLEFTRLATLRVLRHCAGQDARLVVVDNASSDGTVEWLKLLADRGDIDLMRSPTNLGHGPGLEWARRQTRSTYLVTLDSDAFPLSDDWLPKLRARLDGSTLVTGIRHHRDYIHPSCLMIARRTLDDLGVTFLNEKDGPDGFDVAERISHEVKRRGGRIGGLERTGALGRGSASEPVDLGSEYEGLVYHQWYTTRAAMSPGRPVDDVPREQLGRCLREALDRDRKEPRELTVVMGVRSVPSEPERLHNARACLRALGLQDLARWRYRVVVVEQDREPRLEAALSPLADRYLFAFNPGPYNRGWAFNIGASLASSRSGALCLIDADLLVPPDFLRSGLITLQAGHRAVLPYGGVLYLDAASTAEALRDRFDSPMRPLDPDRYRGRRFTTSQGGTIWVDSDLYREIGGHDERFRGWGREDREFWDRLAQATSIERIDQTLLHLDHPRPPMEDRWALANQRLFEQPSPNRPARSTSEIGNLALYATEAAADITPLGAREWENWHRWAPGRIERIVSQEVGQPVEASRRNRLAAIVASLGDRLLDVGCGPGALWPRLEPYRPRLSWVGADATPAMVAAARRLFPDVPVYHADAGCLPFDDASFDVVLLRHVLEHLPHDLMVKALGEAVRVARLAVVIDFFVPAASWGGRCTHRVGENFLETRWMIADLISPISAAGWQLSHRRTIRGGDGETDEIWILRPSSPGTTLPCSTAKPSALDQIKVSIIMPTYRRAHTIFRTIETIRAQTHRNWELIVVDNAGDASYLFDDDRILIYRHAETPSASYARNQGLAHATGELVCFFDDDDEMFPTYIERFVEALLANPNAKMARCGMLVTGDVVNYSYATPECCLRRSFATPTWKNLGHNQDQVYFTEIISSHGWTESQGDLILIPQPLCRACADPTGGLRVGRY